MSRKLEETFDAILGSVKSKIHAVETETESREIPLPPPPFQPRKEPSSPSSEKLEPFEGLVDQDPVEERLETLPTDPDGFVARHIENEKVVKYASGMYLAPNYLSDYLMKNLSLGEQVVFHRLYRLCGGLQRKTEGMSINELADSVGLNPKFAATLIKALVDKGLLKVLWSNPLLKKVRFKLILPKEIDRKIVLCAICHDLIHPEEDWRYFPIARTLKGRVHAVVAHRTCVDGDPYWDGSAGPDHLSLPERIEA